MSPTIANKKRRHVTTNATNGWDVAIAVTTKQLQAIEAMSAKLRFSLNYFLERKKNGDAFSGEDALRKSGLIHEI